MNPRALQAGLPRSLALSYPNQRPVAHIALTLTLSQTPTLAKGIPHKLQEKKKIEIDNVLTIA